MSKYCGGLRRFINIVENMKCPLCGEYVHYKEEYKKKVSTKDDYYNLVSPPYLDRFARCYKCNKDFDIYREYDIEIEKIIKIELRCR